MNTPITAPASTTAARARRRAAHARCLAAAAVLAPGRTVSVEVDAVPLWTGDPRIEGSTLRYVATAWRGASPRATAIASAEGAPLAWGDGTQSTVAEGLARAVEALADEMERRVAAKVSP
jgi:hypothetical protein